ncbi:MAG TPA: hypothetical protein VLE53_19305 [Gemmatimonadaceae bacterium]|nr:hypothetical protein [Gemmatimonadaceae bacterium]
MRHRSTLGFSLLLLSAGCLPPSEQDLQVAQALVEIGDAMAEVRESTAFMQDQLDSLRWVVARQDTVIRQLANLAGVPIPR